MDIQPIIDAVTAIAIINGHSPKPRMTSKTSRVAIYCPKCNKNIFRESKTGKTLTFVDGAVNPCGTLIQDRRYSWDKTVIQSFIDEGWYVQGGIFGTTQARRFKQ